MSRDAQIRPADDVSEPGFVRRLFETVEALLNGYSRNQGSFTLTANVTSTTVSHPLFESHQTPVFVPLTANAAGALATMYVSARTKGSFTLTHANTATSDRSFEYIFVG